MDPISQTQSSWKPSISAAALLFALELVAGRDSMPTTASEVLRQTGSGKSQAYEMLGRLKEFAANPERPLGRPQSQKTPEHVALELVSRCRDFLMRNPGAVRKREGRSVYSDEFRRFALDQFDSHRQALTIDQMAELLGVALSTFKTWLYPSSPTLNLGAVARSFSISIPRGI
jgi:hypothetical protein